MESSSQCAKGPGNHDAALTRLLAEHGPAVYRQIAAKIPPQWQALLSADDVMQQACADAFLHFDSFTSVGGGSFRAWLATIADRNRISALRMLEAEKRGGSHRKIELRSPDDSLMALYELLSATTSTPSRRAARAEACAAVRRALETLSAEYRQVVESYDLRGDPIEEVARAMKRSKGAVYMMRARAHQRLAETLGSASAYLTST